MKRNKFINALWFLLLGGLIISFSNNISKVSAQETNIAGGGGSPRLAELTLAKYNRIKIGMTYSEVVGIIGGKGIETTSSEADNTRIVSYKWEGKDFKIINVTFTNDKVSSKFQANLTDEKIELTFEQYEKIKNEMSYREVADIIGSEGTETFSSTIGKYKTVSYKWEDDNFKLIYATFQNDKLTSKTQANLKTTPRLNVELTLAKYHKLKTGMSYAEVVNIIGGEGTESFSSIIGKYKTVSYKWEGPNFQFIYATFQNDKLTSKTQANLE